MTKDTLAEEINSDRPALSSSIYSGDHMFVLRSNEEKKRPEDEHLAKLKMSLNPEWYHLPFATHKLQIDPAEITQVDFERDLGTLSRSMIYPSKSKVFERDQRKVFEKMTVFESLEEIFLMVVAGLAPIKQSKYNQRQNAFHSN